MLGWQVIICGLNSENLALSQRLYIYMSAQKATHSLNAVEWEWERLPGSGAVKDKQLNMRNCEQRIKSTAQFFATLTGKSPPLRQRVSSDFCRDIVLTTGRWVPSAWPVHRDGEAFYLAWKCDWRLVGCLIHRARKRERLVGDQVSNTKSWPLSLMKLIPTEAFCRYLTRG
jgi:hypothetical protein